MDQLPKDLNNMETIIQLQNQVKELAESNKRKVQSLEEKFEKVVEVAFGECPVCYTTITQKNTCCMPNCDHNMCKSCYYNWLDKQEKNTCPMCRAEVFKNNDQIREKKSALIKGVNDLNNDLQDLQSEKEKKIDELEVVKDDIYDAERDYWQLEDEIFDKQQILEEIKVYQKDPEKWKKKKEKRLRKQIIIGLEIWRENMKEIIPDIYKSHEKKCLLLKTSNKNSSYYQQELERLHLEFEKRINIIRQNIEAEYGDPINFFEITIFDEPEEFSGYEDRIDICGHNPGAFPMILSHDSDSDDDTASTASIYELNDVATQELEDIILQDSEFLF